MALLMIVVSSRYDLCCMLLQFQQAKINHDAAQNEAAKAIYRAK